MYSEYGFREDWTASNSYGFIGNIISNIITETIPGDILHVGRYNNALFINTMKLYFEKYHITHARICSVEYDGNDKFCIRHISPGVWNEDTENPIDFGCISFLHIHDYHEEVVAQALENNFDRISNNSINWCWGIDYCRNE